MNTPATPLDYRDEMLAALARRVAELEAQLACATRFDVGALVPFGGRQPVLLSVEGYGDGWWIVADEDAVYRSPDHPARGYATHQEAIAQAQAWIAESRPLVEPAETEPGERPPSPLAQEIARRMLP